MRCRHCGGAIVEDQWEPGKLKCQSCGRRVADPQDPKENKIMEEKKTCIKCGKELPRTEEYFSKNARREDGFEGQCKTCRKKYFADYCAGKRVRKGAKKAEKKAAGKKDTGPKIMDHRYGPKKVESSELLTKASPAEILIALRKGMAAEIVAMIEEKYDL